MSAPLQSGGSQTGPLTGTDPEDQDGPVGTPQAGIHHNPSLRQGKTDGGLYKSAQ
ncbi:hypothetical protein FRC12_013716, partial [Ceratobasidium sp. 428]